MVNVRGAMFFNIIIASVKQLMAVKWSQMSFRKRDCAMEELYCKKAARNELDLASISIKGKMGSHSRVLLAFEHSLWS